jgi:hypothetical protein
MQIVIEIWEEDEPIMKRTTNDWEVAEQMLESLHHEYERQQAQAEMEAERSAESQAEELEAAKHDYHPRPEEAI